MDALHADMTNVILKQCLVFFSVLKAKTALADHDIGNNLVVTPESLPNGLAEGQRSVDPAPVPQGTDDSLVSQVQGQATADEEAVSTETRLNQDCVSTAQSSPPHDRGTNHPSARATSPAAGRSQSNNKILTPRVSDGVTKESAPIGLQHETTSQEMEPQGAVDFDCWNEKSLPVLAGSQSPKQTCSQEILGREVTCCSPSHEVAECVAESSLWSTDSALKTVGLPRIGFGTFGQPNEAISVAQGKGTLAGAAEGQGTVLRASNKANSIFELLDRSEQQVMAQAGSVSDVNMGNSCQG